MSQGTAFAPDQRAVARSLGDEAITWHERARRLVTWSGDPIANCSTYDAMIGLAVQKFHRSIQEALQVAPP